MIAGKHCEDIDVMMVEIAEGVKGLLMIRRESFVVCAFKRLEESRRRRRGCGGSGVEETSAAGELREACNVVTKLLVELIMARSWDKSLSNLSVAMMGRLEMRSNQCLAAKVRYLGKKDQCLIDKGMCS